MQRNPTIALTLAFCFAVSMACDDEKSADSTDSAGAGGTQSDGGAGGTAGGSDGQAGDGGHAGLPSDGGTAGDGEAPPTPEILSAYFGLDNALPPLANVLCQGASGKDGMPIVLRDKLPNQPVDPSVFRVETAAGSETSIHCATLMPAIEPTELRTVLLIGEFGSAPDDEPASVAIVGSLVTQDGTDLKGASTQVVTPLADGARLVVAERLPQSDMAGDCPPSTVQGVQLTWQGGVTAAGGADLGDEAREAITVLVDDGDTTAAVTPFAIGDIDNDNYVVACLDDARPAVQVDVAAGEFYDPGGDPNPATSVEVTDPP